MTENKALPVLKNEKYEVTIEAVSSDGNGICHIDGYTLFVPDSCAGDVLEVMVLKTKANYGYAKIVNIITPSKNRCESFCDEAKKCGGCAFCHIGYAEQLRLKRDFVKDAITRIAGISDFEISDTVGMEKPLRYRNKMVFPCSYDKEGNATFGFFRERTHEVIPLTDCYLGDEVNFKILKKITEYMNTFKIAPYSEDTKKGVIRRAFIRKAYHKDEIMVVISATKKPIETDLLVSLILTASPNIKSIILNINKGNNNLVLGDKNITLYGSDTISDTLLDFEYEISPNSFFQVNPQQTEKLYSLAIEYAEIKPSDSVLDIYCGIGTISLLASKYAKKVVGVEIVPFAIENAKKNAKKNKIKNAEFFAGDAKIFVPKLINSGEAFDVVILDPARKGSDPETLLAIAKAEPKKIVYVSCNPATLARDIKTLEELGYKLKKVTPVDMFPHTTHVECIVQLCRTIHSSI